MVSNRSDDAFAEAYNELNHEQKEAVDQLEGPLLVIAGPGSGKTQLLATRVGNILKQTDASAENILCLTFSESAVSAIRQRLATLIGPAARDVTVSTYHGFGRTLIATYPEQFNQEVIDAKPADELLLDKLLRQVQAELPYANQLKNDYYLHDLKSLISGYKRALITPELLERVIKSNTTFMDRVNEILEQLFKPDFKLSKSGLSLFADLLQETETLASEPIENIVPLQKLWQESLEQAFSAAQEQNKTTPIREWKDRWLETNSEGHFVVVSPRILRKQQAFVEVYRKYNKLLSDSGLYDYDDMIMLAIKGLSENLDLKQTLQERYLYVQLDEFQDTNEAQLKLVELLGDHPLNEGRPNILAVGDDDQAIYSFQGAHYSHMERFFNIYRDVKLIGLKENYRSTQEIIDLSAQVREQIKDRLDLIPKQQISKARVAKEALIERVELDKDIETLAWVAKFVREQIKKGTPAEEIAVFAPKHQLLIDLIPFLHAEDVAINYEQRNNILEDPRIDELLSAARLASRLQDTKAADVLWPKVLSHAYWQLPTSLIWKLSLEAYDLRRPWTELVFENPQTKVIALYFMRLNQLSAEAPFELILSYLLGSQELPLNEKDIPGFTSPFYSYYFKELAQTDGGIEASTWQLLGQLTILTARAQESSEQSLNLIDFIDFCDSYRLAKLVILDTSPFRESLNAANLMTAYAAKGQEFDTVILLDAVDNVWGKSAKRQSDKISLPANLAHVRLNKNTDDDKLRLLFVALSRAKRKLIITSYKSSLSGRNSEPLSYLNEHQQSGQLISPFLPKMQQVVKRPRSSEVLNLATAPNWWNRHLDNFKAERTALLKDRLENFHLSATALNNFTNVSGGGPQSFFVNEILKFPQTQSERAQYGSAMHLTLDWLFKQTQIAKGHPPKIVSVLSEFEHLLSQRQLTNSEFKQLLLRGQEALKSYLIQVPFSVGADDLSEFASRPVIGKQQNIRLSGAIDRLSINNQDKTIKIMDYKTGVSYNRWSNSDIKSLHHKRQLYFYKLLLENTSRFKGYSVTQASIQFVEPNEEGEIINIELQFNPEEEKYLKNLITAVWQRIMNLDFPSTENYSEDVKGILAFERDLLSRADIQ